MTLRPMRHRLGQGLVVAACCAHSLAQAEPRLHVALEYVADPVLGCPSESELSATVTERLGYNPFSSEGSEPRLRIAINRSADGAVAQLEWTDRQQRGEGERRIVSRGGNCVELARSLAFAVAVQIQLHASASAPAEGADPSAPPTPPRVRPPPEPPRAIQARPERVVLVGLGALARHGLTPGVSPGVRLFAGLSQQRWSLELSGHATLPSDFQLADGSGFAANEVGANLAPCWRISTFGLCALGTLSIVHVRGHGVDRVGSPSSLTGGVGGRLQLGWPALERFGVVVQGEALAVLAPRHVSLNQMTVWSTAPVAFTVMLDFVAIFR
ncbi:MAG: hypothetical protein ABIQ16_24420 [Polyangiaceae bacterium]